MHFGQADLFLLQQLPYALRFFATMSITLIIIAITVGASFMAWQNSEWFEKGITKPYDIVHFKEYYRIVSGGFLHADYGHLAFNMLSLFFFGDVVNSYFNVLYTNGTAMYVALYIFALIISSLPDVFKHKNNRHYGSIGASGAVSAVIFAAIWLDPLNKVYLFGAVGIPGFIFGGIYLLYSKYMAKQPGRDNINHDAHFYGSVFGVLFPLITSPGTFMNFVDAVGRFRL